MVHELISSYLLASWRISLPLHKYRKPNTKPIASTKYMIPDPSSMQTDQRLRRVLRLPLDAALREVVEREDDEREARATCVRGFLRPSRSKNR
jgi:hypothetical protein